MNILFVSSECYPLLKTGGLADVVGALPPALDQIGIKATVFMPAFPSALKALKKAKKIASFNDIFGTKSQLIQGITVTGLSVLMMHSSLFDVEGNPYVDIQGIDREGNDKRYAAFSAAAADLALGKIIKSIGFDGVHAHDWQAALTFAYLEAAKALKKPKRILTIHNLAFQGIFPHAIFSQLKLPERFFSQDTLEYWGQVSYLKAGVIFSDHITTVSPTYAREIQTEDEGMGFGGLLKSLSDKVNGITNGIDDTIWNPERDNTIAAPYSAGSIAGKAVCKKNLQQTMGLKRSVQKPLFSVISRLTSQKGLDMVAEAIPHLIHAGAQLAVLGSGDKDLEHKFLAAADAYKGQVAVYIGYNEALAHQVQAGSDAILIPSRFEPCGLTQLCAMRYGTLPLVSRVGGLNDTVIDASEYALKAGVATGFHMQQLSTHHLKVAVDSCMATFQQKKQWSQMRRNAMKQDLSWQGPALAYKALYES